MHSLKDILKDYNDGESTFQITASKLVELAENDDGIVDYGKEGEDGLITCLFPDPNCQVIINYADKSIIKI